jgi:hypothetical protein
MQKAALFATAVVLLLVQLQVSDAQAAAAPATTAAAMPAVMSGSCPLSAEDFATIDYAPLRRACGEHHLTHGLQHLHCSRLLPVDQLAGSSICCGTRSLSADVLLHSLERGQAVEQHQQA